MKKPELLAPAGNFKCLVAAIKAGADAVYFGLQEFNMRDAAKNFTLKDLNKINEFCKEKKVKKYLTLNTIIYDEELKKVEKIIKSVKGKVDAIICWDLSVISLCKKYKIPFHISTQASVANAQAALFYKNLGAKRIVLARELNLEQIKNISKVIPTEVFIHGAMCVSISGRCFTSQFLFNKSANRGQCLHPCRRSYKIIDEEGNELKLENNKVMSAKDLCALPFVEELKKAGITSFKIEGRIREPEYVYQVTRVYKKALDKKLTKKELKQGLDELKKVYNREFSSGFLIKTPTSDDFTRTDSGAALESKEVIGRVSHYWDKIGVAHVKLYANKKIKQGDEIIISGDSTFVRTKINEMEINHKKVKEASGDVGVKVPKCKKGDEIYLIKKK